MTEYPWTGESAYCKCGRHITKHINWEKLKEIESDHPDICCTGDLNCPCDEYKPDKVKPDSNVIATVEDCKQYK